LSLAIRKAQERRAKQLKKAIPAFDVDPSIRFSPLHFSPLPLTDRDLSPIFPKTKNEPVKRSTPEEKDRIYVQRQ
jgi:hypothetical protein